MNTIYDQIVAHHLALKEALADNPDAVQLEEVQSFIRLACKAGADVADIAQRDQMRSMLRQWGAFIYERTGEYPPVQLAPLAERPGESVFSTWLRRVKRAGLFSLVIGGLLIVLVLATSVLIRPMALSRPMHTPTPTGIPTLSPTVPTPTRRPTNTPTSKPYPAPGLAPAAIIGCNVTFGWTWLGILGSDEWFAVRVRNVGIDDRPYSVSWVKESKFTFSSLRPR